MSGDAGVMENEALSLTYELIGEFNEQQGSAV
jgi:hypothetical protein